jgi:hypothetical protein
MSGTQGTMSDPCRHNQVIQESACGGVATGSEGRNEADARQRWLESRSIASFLGGHSKPAISGRVKTGQRVVFRYGLWSTELDENDCHWQPV